MSRILKTNGWASVAACLAMAIAAAGNAVAQEEQQSQQNQASQEQQQSSDDQDQQTRQSDSQSKQSSDQASQEQQSQNQQSQTQQERQRAQQQRQQQQRTRQQEARQRDQQSRQRNQSSWSTESSRDADQWSSPRRYESDRDWQQTNRDQQGGLGVNITSDGREGIVVEHVHRGSPAEEMGIRTGDRITQINGQQIDSTQDFISQIRNMDPGEQVELDIRRARGGDERTVRGELESRAQALVERRQQSDRYNPPGQRWSDEGREFGQQSDRYGRIGRSDDSQQTSYEEERGEFGGGRSSQLSAARIEQIERQVDRLSQQIDDLRQSLQDIRRQGNQRDREQTAGYEESESRAIQSP